MSNCNKCNPCGCNECQPASYTCGLDVQVDPYDNSTWLFNLCGQLHRVKMPKNPETCTDLTTDFSAANLIYNGECGQSIISGRQLGELINLDDLRDVEVPDANSCDLLVYDPGCTDCGDGCKPKPAAWRNYHIPDAGDCVMDTDNEGYYHVLVKDDCGCIKECKMSVVPMDGAVIDYMRDSVPDDPDFPWYYGIYNDRIDLDLAHKAPEYFGKYALEVTVNYGIQVIHSKYCHNVNFRSIVVPVIVGEGIDITKEASTLQDDSTSAIEDLNGNKSNYYIPWGSKSMRSSFTFIVPKGKEAYLHHEFRLRSNTSWGTGQYGYLTNPTYDGKRVPDEVSSVINNIRWNASRLNALQVLVRPTRSTATKQPTQTYREQLDPPVDEYPPIPV